MTNFTDLEWQDGKVNPAGIKSIGYWIPKTDIETLAKIADDPANAVAEVTYVGDHVLKAGKEWKTIYCTQGKGNVNFEPIGEKDCKMYTNKGSLKYPDISEEAKAFAKGTVNSNCIFIIPMPGNKYVQLGGEDYDTTVVCKGASGDAPGSDKGLTIEIEAPDTLPLPNYIGSIKTSKGTLDCETGVFTSTEG